MYPRFGRAVPGDGSRLLGPGRQPHLEEARAAPPLAAEQKLAVTVDQRPRHAGQPHATQAIEGPLQRLVVARQDAIARRVRVQLRPEEVEERLDEERPRDEADRDADDARQPGEDIGVPGAVVGGERLVTRRLKVVDARGDDHEVGPEPGGEKGADREKVRDVTDRKNLTPVAIHDATAFVETVLEAKPAKVDYGTIPTAVFSTPEIGTVGLSEEKAREMHGAGAVDIYKISFRPLRSMISGRDERTLFCRNQFQATQTA